MNFGHQHSDNTENALIFAYTQIALTTQDMLNTSSR